MCTSNKFQDLTNQIFGRLKVIQRVEDYISPKGRHNPQWLCQCECGSPPKIVSGNSLKQGLIKSCGCLHKETARNLRKNKTKINKYDLTKDYGVGYDYNNQQFYFDIEEYNKIKDYYWYVQKDGYVRCLRNGKKIYLHRLIMQCPSHLCVDHINHNTFDNRKCNLRIATKQQNNQNVIPHTASGVTGVYQNKKNNKWYARITVNYTLINLGTFDKLTDAIKARRNAEIKYFGEYRYNNDKEII